MPSAIAKRTLNDHIRQTPNRSISSSETACLDAFYSSAKCVLAVFLDLRLDITDACLDLAGVLLDLSFQFQTFVAGDMPRDFLHFAFGLFIATLHLCFVPLSVLSMN